MRIIDYRTSRGLDGSYLLKLIKSCWIETHDNLPICGPAGIGPLLGGLGGKCLHLLRRHCEALAGAPGSCRLDGRVEAPAG